MTFSDGSLRQANPVLHGVPFGVIPNQQVLLRAVGATNGQFSSNGFRLRLLGLEPPLGLGPLRGNYCFGYLFDRVYFET
jgi:hypothetical protein